MNAEPETENKSTNAATEPSAGAPELESNAEPEHRVLDPRYETPNVDPALEPRTPANRPGPKCTFNAEADSDLVCRLAMLGATNADLAEVFDVAESTISNWQHGTSTEARAFQDAWRLGRARADSLVVGRLFDRANGMTVVEQQAFKVKQGPHNESVEIVDVTKEIPPDVAAIKFWLSARRADKWNDKKRDAQSEADSMQIALQNVSSLIQLLGAGTNARLIQQARVVRGEESPQALLPHASKPNA